MRGKAGCKVNDIVLAVIAGALRAYLAERGVTAPASVVRALVPVNVRRADESLTLGNRVSAMVASLPIDEADALERLRRVVTDMRGLKESGQSRALEVALAVAGAAPAPAGPLVAWLAALRPLVHTVCTNVPGPRDVRRILGRRVLEIHPIVPLALDMGLGFAILSYAGGLSIGINSDPRLVPDVERLPRLLTAAADELRTRLGVDLDARIRPAVVARAAAPTVGDLMSRDPVTVAPYASLAAAWTIMHDRRIRHLPVVNGSERLLGLVTHRDLLAAAQSSLIFGREDERVRLLARSTAEEIMETHLSTATAAEPAAAAGLRMVRHKIGCLPVLGDDDRVIGIVTEEDFLRWAAERMAASAA
jgi:CBS domain-containing protein